MATRSRGLAEHPRLIGREVDRQQDLRDGQLQILGTRGRLLQRQVDLVLGHHDPRPELAVDHLDPGDLAAQLVAHLVLADPALGQCGLEGADVEAVALGDGGQGLVDLVVADRELKPLGLLHLQLLVDEAAQHLLRQPLPGLGVVGQHRWWRARG